MDRIITGWGETVAPAERMLGDEDRIRLADIVESSLRVVKRSQFYLWDQGAVQALLPHDILICGIASGAERALQFHRFCVTRYFRQECFDAVCDPREGLMPRVMAMWSRSREPVLVSPGPEAGETGGVAGLVVRNELRNLAAHGMHDAEGRLASYFSFSRIGCEFGPRLAYLLELLTPVFHVTFTRVLMGEQGARVAGAERRGLPITRRQTEILKWIIAGKTNNDIAALLALSPWTVKNHMRAIMKKLAVENRSHAVARAISLGILDSAE